jgi:hypothetical protein
MKPGRPSDAWRLLLSACAGVFLLFSYFGQKSTPSLLLVDLTHFALPSCLPWHPFSSW